MFEIFDMIAISDTLENLLNLVLIPLAGFGVKLFIDWAKAQRLNQNATVQVLINGAVKVAVMAVEQVYELNDGEAKKAKALEIASAYLEKFNLDIDLAILEEAIEAAVWEELKKWEQPAVRKRK